MTEPDCITKSFAEPACVICGVPFIDHVGLMGLCADFRKLRDDLERLKDERNRAHVDAYRKLSKGATATIPVELLDTYIALFRAAEIQEKTMAQSTLGVLCNAIKAVRKAGEPHTRPATENAAP